MKIAYQAIVERGEVSGFFVYFPDLKEAFSEGTTETEAMFNAEEVLNLTLEGRIEEGMEIPEPQQHERGVWVYPSAQIQAALLIRKAREGNKTLAELARALDTSWPSAQQLENPRNSPNLKRLDLVAAALGKKLVLSLDCRDESSCHAIDQVSLKKAEADLPPPVRKIRVPAHVKLKERKDA